MKNLLFSSIFLLCFPYPTFTQKTLSHGLPFLKKSRIGPSPVHFPEPKLFLKPTKPIPLHKPNFLPHSHSLPPTKPYHGPPPLLKSPLPPVKPSHSGHFPALKHVPSHVPHGHPNDVYDVYDVPANYHFTYHVADSYSGDVHHHSESKTEHKTEGQYSVKLPDGRTQVVTYTADDDGYHATVEYHGDIIHQPPHPNHHTVHHLPNSILHGPSLIADPIKHEIESRDPILTAPVPAPAPPLLPKLFIPKKLDGTLARKPSLKLEAIEPPQSLPPHPIVPEAIKPTIAPKYRYSPTPTPYPRIGGFHHEPVVKPSIYKGKLVFINKP